MEFEELDRYTNNQLYTTTKMQKLLLTNILRRKEMEEGENEIGDTVFLRHRFSLSVNVNKPAEQLGFTRLLGHTLSTTLTTCCQYSTYLTNTNMKAL